ncbi:hypothetical protein RSOL_309380, partial [Rhizoctonia solani AG-3 Rhs1AP]
MVSFKLTTLLTAATFFLGASAHAIPGSNLSPGTESLSPRAFGDNANHAEVNTDDTKLLSSSTSSSSFAKHVVDVEGGLNRLTGNLLRKNPKLMGAKQRLHSLGKNLVQMTSEDNSRSHNAPAVPGDGSLEGAANIEGIDEGQNVE